MRKVIIRVQSLSEAKRAKELLYSMGYLQDDSIAFNHDVIYVRGDQYGEIAWGETVDMYTRWLLDGYEVLQLKQTIINEFYGH